MLCNTRSGMQLPEHTFGLNAYKVNRYCSYNLTNMYLYITFDVYCLVAVFASVTNKVPNDMRQIVDTNKC